MKKRQWRGWAVFSEGHRDLLRLCNGAFAIYRTLRACDLAVDEEAVRVVITEAPKGVTR